MKLFMASCTPSCSPGPSPDAAEGRELQPVARHLAHVDRAHVELADEAGDVVQPVGADRARQAVGRAVGDADGLVDVRKRMMGETDRRSPRTRVISGAPGR